MRRFIRSIRPATGLAALLACVPSIGQTPLADQALFASITVPGNLALALSVEFPTAITAAHTDSTYNSASTYIGYFDPNKCYAYSPNTDETLRHFYPTAVTTNHACVSSWSGNFMNWATMQAIDPFRWALTGGFRYLQSPTTTILEKAWAANQGGTGNFSDRTLSAGVSGATPFAWGSFRMRVWGAGNKLKFSQSGNVSNASVAYDGTAPVAATVYDVSVRVKVCDPSLGLANLEPNCTQYGSGSTIVYRPTGLMQKYSNQIRYSAFGYLNDSDIKRDGGVLRAQQKFIGPTQPVVGSNVPAANGLAEWSASTGIIVDNPDLSDAADTASAAGFNTPIANSGVMNYLNKFGSINRSTYKTYDPVGELYYATLRYFKNQGNVPEWSAPGSANAATRATWADGFPVITRWNDPIQYSCQKNFVLGIGDVNTHADRNLPSASGSSEPSKPASVAADATVDSVLWTNKVGVMSGISNLGNTQNYNGCCNNNGALMAGLAYHANTQDIRPDLAGRQSVQTYWLDVLENGYRTNNQFFLATKYGGFTVPELFDASRTTDLPTAWWHTGPASDANSGQLRPDNYFTAARADLMVAGLSNAFASIAKKLQAASTGFVTATPVVNASGDISYAARYDTSDWSGDVLANQVVVDNDRSAVTTTLKWSFATALSTQAAGNGWSTRRFIATYNTDSKVGVAFQLANLASDQQAALATSYRGADGSDYLDYLRGDRKNEKSSAANGSARAYRDRSSLVGDIVDAKLVVVGPPASGLATASNPGYGAFKSTYANRKTMVYAATNRGMVHAIDGSGSSTGKEVFAYVPGALYDGPSGTPATNGLQAIGNPSFVHYNFVDATPTYADVDMGRTKDGTGTADWRTILVGGLGKGGRSIYALDITNPAATVTDEATAVSKVLWEFTDDDLGYTYGQPTVLKTRAYGWVVVIGSGYNNRDGKGYVFILNARTGALLKKLGTGIGSTGTPAGLADVQGFVLDLTDGTADALYAGDLLGNVWRVDVTATNGSYPSPLLLAQLKDSGGAALPITSRVTPMVQPGTNRRFVTVGTGRLLHANDISSSQGQALFAIIDGTAARFGQSTTLPSGVSYPIVRGNLKQLANLQTGIVLNLSTQVGWYIDLGAISAGPGWRVIDDPAAFYGIVAFTTVAPTSNDVCQPGGTSRVYAIDLGTGVSALPNKQGYLDFAGLVTDLSFYSIGSQSYIIPTVCDRADNCKSPPVKVTPASGLGVRRLNWREIPQTN